MCSSGLSVREGTTHTHTRYAHTHTVRTHTRYAHVTLCTNGASFQITCCFCWPPKATRQGPRGMHMNSLHHMEGSCRASHIAGQGAWGATGASAYAFHSCFALMLCTHALHSCFPLMLSTHAFHLCFALREQGGPRAWPWLSWVAIRAQCLL